MTAAAAADTCFAASLIAAGALAADLLWGHVRKMDRRTGEERRERDDAAMRRALQRNGESWPRWRP